MKSIRVLATLMLVCAVFFNAKAQSAIDESVKEWERAKAYTKEYLDAMPEDKYSLKPTPEMRSFADQMQHLADANFVFTAAAAGVKIPDADTSLEKSAPKTKAAVTKQVLDSYDFVISNLKKMTPAQLNEKVKLFGSFEMTKGTAMAKCFEHQTHHRGQETVYLRLAGVKPPQEKLF